MSYLEVGLGVADFGLELIVLVVLQLEGLRQAPVEPLPTPDPEGWQGLVKEPAFR